MCNLDVLERLAAAWNPPEVEGVVTVAEGTHPHTFHLHIAGSARGYELQVLGPALHKSLLSNSDHRRILAREARDFFASALTSHPEISSRTAIHC